MSDVEVVSFVNGESPHKIIDILVPELLKTFKCSSIEALPENYGNSVDWALLNMLTNGSMDTYQVIMVDGIFWSGSGGRLLNGGDYQCGVRTFTGNNFDNLGLTRNAYTVNHSISYQVERAKYHGCSRAVLTFNDYNRRLFRVLGKFVMNSDREKVDSYLSNFKAMPEMENINGVDQWVMELKL